MILFNFCSANPLKIETNLISVATSLRFAWFFLKQLKDSCGFYSTHLTDLTIVAPNLFSRLHILDGVKSMVLLGSISVQRAKNIMIEVLFLHHLNRLIYTNFLGARPQSYF
jgi:hypothetical protein